MHYNTNVPCKIQVKKKADEKSAPLKAWVETDKEIFVKDNSENDIG